MAKMRTAGVANNARESKVPESKVIKPDGKINPSGMNSKAPEAMGHEIKSNEEVPPQGFPPAPGRSSIQQSSVLDDTKLEAKKRPSGALDLV